MYVFLLKSNEKNAILFNERKKDRKKKRKEKDKVVGSIGKKKVFNLVNGSNNFIYKNTLP